MPFVKLVKNKAYFKRYQTKFRRRREGKTDFYARKRLVVQAKNKYASAKYRLVVRITNRAVICQVVYATLAGDQVLASAYSTELSRYGLKVGLKNYAAAYCTGLLVARRLLQKLGLDSVYEGNTEVDGTIKKTGFGRTYYVEELDDDRRPFRANLDVGIRCTTTGARVFGAMKGASDGGLDVPHTYKRFPGYDSESKSYNADEHRARIFGQHVAEYMKTLEEEDTTAYQRQFAEYIKAGVSADDLEKLYESVHSAIRADPSPTPKKERYHDSRYHNRPKLSYEQRKDRVRQKKIARARALQAQLAAEDED